QLALQMPPLGAGNGRQFGTLSTATAAGASPSTAPTIAPTPTSVRKLPSVVMIPSFRRWRLMTRSWPAHVRPVPLVSSRCPPERDGASTLDVSNAGASQRADQGVEFLRLPPVGT